MSLHRGSIILHRGLAPGGRCWRPGVPLVTVLRVTAEADIVPHRELVRLSEPDERGYLRSVLAMTPNNVMSCEYVGVEPDRILPTL